MPTRRDVLLASIAVVSDVTQNADPDARVRAWLISNQRETPVSVPILACSCAIVIVGLEGSKRLMA